MAASAYWLVAFPYGAVQYSLCVGLRPWLIVLAWALGAVFLWLERRYAIAALRSMVAALDDCACTAFFGIIPGYIAQRTPRRLGPVDSYFARVRWRDRICFRSSDIESLSGRIRTVEE